MLARVFIRSTRRSTAFLSPLPRDLDSLETDATAEDEGRSEILVPSGAIKWGNCVNV